MTKATCVLSFLLACMLLFSGCTVSDNAGAPLSAADAQSQGYTACKVCKS